VIAISSAVIFRHLFWLGLQFWSTYFIGYLVGWPAHRTNMAARRVWLWTFAVFSFISF